MKATLDGGALQELKCEIKVPGADTIILNNLPDISDSKSASYADEAVIGRSFPIKTYSHSENRSISMKVHFHILSRDDAQKNMAALRALQSAVYPRDEQANALYLPPPICKIKCGNLLAGSQKDGEVCVVLKQYNVSFPTDVAWFSEANGEGSYLPYRFDMDLTWEVVYANEELPGQESIMRDI